LNESLTDGAHVNLMQNYPNPASTYTRISYDIDASMMVSLEITDMPGEVIMRPVEKYQAAGHYELDIDCSKLSAGNYLYKLSAGNAIQVKKLVIIK
jgi:hypothetical protein